MKTLKTLLMALVAVAFSLNVNAQCVDTNEDDLVDLCVTATETANAAPTPAGTFDVWDSGTMAAGMDGTDDVSLTMEAVVFTPNANGTCDDGDFTITGCVGPGAGADWSATTSDDCYCTNGYVCITVDMINGFSSEASGLDFPFTSVNGSTEGHEAMFAYVTAGTDANGNPLTLPTVNLAALSGFCEPEYNAGSVSAFVGATGPGTFAVDQNTGVTNDCATSGQSGEDTESGDNPGDNSDAQTENPNWGLNATDLVTQYKMIYFFGNTPGTDCDADGDTGVGTNPGANFGALTFCPPVEVVVVECGACTEGTAGLVITELSYDPSGTQGNDGDCEYIEIFNSYSNPITTDASTTVTLSGGTTVTLPAGITIMPGEYIILTGPNFGGCTWTNPPPAGTQIIDAGVAGTLGNGGEDVTITLACADDPAAGNTQTVTWSDATTPNAGGGGSSVYYPLDGTGPLEAEPTPGSGDCTACAMTEYTCATVACAIEADLMTAPAPPTVTESTCQADGMTVDGGVVDPITCPAGATAEYSIDGGTTWVTTVPMYDQTTAITVTVRCLCDEDMTTASPTAEVTTVPGMCTSTCAIEADLMAAPAPPTVTESTCQADGMTVDGGIVDPITCPAGATAEYSIDGGTTWTATVPAYDQTNPITVTVRCLCDEDMMTASPTAEVTTVPGMCMPATCSITGLTAIPTACDPATDTYSLDIDFTVTDPGASGMFNVDVCGTAYGPFAYSALPINIPGLPADGTMGCTVTVTDVDNTGGTVTPAMALYVSFVPDGSGAGGGIDECATESVTIHNFSTDAAGCIDVDISGYQLQDNNGVFYTFPAGTVVPAGGSLTITIDQVNMCSGTVGMGDGGGAQFANGGDNADLLDVGGAPVDATGTVDGDPGTEYESPGLTAAGGAGSAMCTSDACSAAMPYDAPASCLAQCPVVTTPLATAEDICDGGAPALDATTLVLDDPTLAQDGTGNVVVTWYTDAALTTAFGGTVAHSGADNCATEDVILYAAIECIATPAPLIAAGQTTITVYPSYDATTLTITNDDCTVATVVSSCANYTITPDPANPAAPGPGMMATFNFTVEYNGGPAGASCFSEVVMSTVNCPAPNCPAVTTPLATAEELCDGGAPVLDASTLVLDDPTLAQDGTGNVVVTWYTDAALTTAFGGTVAHSGADNCATEDVILYAAIECIATPAPLIAAGQTTITVYPSYDATTLTITNDDCTVATVTSSCANYTITPDPANPAAPGPGMMATFNFTVEYNGGPAGASCFSEVVMANVNCPSAGCPSVVPVDAADAVCDGSLAGEITTWQGNVEADAANTAAIADANTDAAVIYSTDAPAAVSEATPPTAGTATGIHSGADLCAAETEMTYAYLLCFGDDGVAGGGDDSYLALGMHTLTVYPLSQAPTIVDDPATCIVTITPACANDVLSQGTLDYNGAMAGALDVIGATAQNEFGCPAVTYDVTHGDCTVPMPSIMILKDDADNGDDTQEAAGGSATFTITIMNNGDEDLCNISLTDTPSDAGVVVTMCEPTFTSIDSNADGILAVGETETYTCTVTGITAAFTNTIAVTAEGCGSGTAVMDDDPTNVTVPMVCEDEIAGMVIGDPSCDLSGITVTITDDMGNIVTTLTTNSMGVYDSTPAVYPCGSYSAELTAGVPACYGDGETGPKDFIIDGDTPMTDTDGPNFGTIANIPTVGEWGLIILGLLMSIVAVVGIRQRNTVIIKE